MLPDFPHKSLLHLFIYFKVSQVMPTTVGFQTICGIAIVLGPCTLICTEIHSPRSSDCKRTFIIFSTNLWAYTILSKFIQQFSTFNTYYLKTFDLLVCATMLVCFLNIAAAVSERVTITSRASWRCILLRLVSPHNYREDVFVCFSSLDYSLKRINRTFTKISNLPLDLAVK